MHSWIARARMTPSTPSMSAARAVHDQAFRRRLHAGAEFGRFGADHLSDRPRRDSRRRRFDFKVEFAGEVDPADGEGSRSMAQDHASAFGQAADFVAREDGKPQSALLLRDVVLGKPGRYVIEASRRHRAPQRRLECLRHRAAQGQERDPVHRRRAVAGASRRRAAAVQGHRARARAAASWRSTTCRRWRWWRPRAPIRSSPIPPTPPAAYATGHKTAVNAMGVYADRTASPFDDPKVETIASLAKRRLDLAIGIVTNTEVEDATPAAMIAHTRRRAAYDEIVAQFFAAKPDVLMGGGAAQFPAEGRAGLKRKDDIDYVAKFRDAGYRVATTASELDGAGGKAGHAKAARPVRARQHGRRARPQIPQGRRRGEESRPARSDRAGRRRARPFCRRTTTASS